MPKSDYSADLLLFILLAEGSHGRTDEVTDKVNKVTTGQDDEQHLWKEWQTAADVTVVCSLTSCNVQRHVHSSQNEHKLITKCKPQ